MVMMYNISLETLIKDVQEMSKDVQRTPLSEYKTWDVKDGQINVGGIYYKKDKVGILPADKLIKILKDLKKTHG
jgi:hypothetical protein